MKHILSATFIVISLATYAQRGETSGGHNKFALTLLAQTHKNGENILLSPFNIYSNLAMIAAGSAGETEAELFRMLNSNNPPGTVASIQNQLAPATNRKVITIANSFWLDATTDLQKDYVERFTTDFKGELFKLPSLGTQESVDKINEWIRIHTDNKIQKAVQVDDMANTVAALINAILFKGTWTAPFDPKETKSANFFLQSGQLSSAMFMHRDGVVKALQKDWIALYELPFHDSLSFVMATSPRANAVHELIEGIEYDPSIITDLVTGPMRCVFYMPKFKFSYKTELVRPLQKMGLNNALGSGANFTKMFTGSGIYLSKILHSADIEVNEKGVEAAAVTVGVFARSMPPTIRLDHPFVFFILSKPSNTIIFEGVLEDPVTGQ